MVILEGLEKDKMGMILRLAVETGIYAGDGSVHERVANFSEVKIGK